MKAMPDLLRICKKFMKGVATLEDVVRIYQVVLKVNIIDLSSFLINQDPHIIVTQLPGMIECLTNIDQSRENASDLLQEMYLKDIQACIAKQSCGLVFDCFIGMWFES